MIKRQNLTHGKYLMGKKDWIILAHIHLSVEHENFLLFIIVSYKVYQQRSFFQKATGVHNYTFKHIQMKQNLSCQK